jgi:hypothetical protein
MSLMRQRRTPYLVLVTALALSLSACTSGIAADVAVAGRPPNTTSGAAVTPSAAVVYQRVRTSGAAARSVHVRGDYTDNGQPLRLDGAGDRDGTTMRLLVDFGSGGIEILMVRDDFYLKADTTFWTRLDSAAVAKVAAGKYVKVPPGSAAGMGDFRVGKLLDRVFAEDVSSADKLNTAVQATTVDGVPAYLMTTRVGGEAKIYVSADGRARLLRTTGAKTGTLDFTEWDSVAPTIAPPEDQRAIVPII